MANEKQGGKPWAPPPVGSGKKVTFLPPTPPPPAGPPPTPSGQRPVSYANPNGLLTARPSFVPPQLTPPQPNQQRPQSFLGPDGVLRSSGGPVMSPPRGVWTIPGGGAPVARQNAPTAVPGFLSGADVRSQQTADFATRHPNFAFGPTAGAAPSPESTGTPGPTNQTPDTSATPGAPGSLPGPVPAGAPEPPGGRTEPQLTAASQESLPLVQGVNNAVYDVIVAADNLKWGLIAQEKNAWDIPIQFLTQGAVRLEGMLWMADVVMAPEIADVTVRVASGIRDLNFKPFGNVDQSGAPAFSGWGAPQSGEYTSDADTAKAVADLYARRAAIEDFLVDPDVKNTLPDGSGMSYKDIMWQRLLGDPFTTDGTLPERLNAGRGMSGLGYTFIVHPELETKFMDDVKAGMSVSDAVTKYEDVGVELIGDTVLDPLWLVPANWIEKVFPQGMFIKDIVIEHVANPILRSVGFDFQMGKAILQKTMAEVLWQQSKGSRVVQYSDKVLDTMATMASRFEASGSTMEAKTYFQQSILEAVDGNLTGHLADLGPDQQAIFVGAALRWSEQGSTDIEKILGKYGIFAEDIVDGVTGSIIADTVEQADAKRIGHYMAGAAAAQYAKELGYTGGAQGSLMRTVSYIGQILKELWLGPNPAYHMTNFSDNVVKTTVSGYAPGPFTLLNPAAIDAKLGAYGVTLPENTLRGYLASTLGLGEEGKPPNLSLAGMMNALQSATGIQSGTWYKQSALNGNSVAAKLLRNINPIRASQNLGSFIEGSARVNIFLQAFDTKFESLHRPALVKMAQGLPGLPTELHDALANPSLIRGPQDLKRWLAAYSKPLIPNQNLASYPWSENIDPNAHQSNQLLYEMSNAIENIQWRYRDNPDDSGMAAEIQQIFARGTKAADRLRNDYDHAVGAATRNPIETLNESVAPGPQTVVQQWLDSNPNANVLALENVHIAATENDVTITTGDKLSTKAEGTLMQLGQHLRELGAPADIPVIIENPRGTDQITLKQLATEGPYPQPLLEAGNGAVGTAGFKERNLATQSDAYPRSIPVSMDPKYLTKQLKAAVSGIGAGNPIISNYLDHLAEDGGITRAEAAKQTLDRITTDGTSAVIADATEQYNQDFGGNRTTAVGNVSGTASSQQSKSLEATVRQAMKQFNFTPREAQAYEAVVDEMSQFWAAQNNRPVEDWFKMHGIIEGKGEADLYQTQQLQWREDEYGIQAAETPYGTLRIIPNPAQPGQWIVNTTQPYVPGEEEDRIDEIKRVSSLEEGKQVAQKYLDDKAAASANLRQEGPFFSKLKAVLDGKKLPARASAAQYKGTILGQGVKPAEMRWTGLGDFLDSWPAGTPLTKDDLQKFYAQNAVVMQETSYPSSVKLQWTDTGNGDLVLKGIDRGGAQGALMATKNEDGTYSVVQYSPDQFTEDIHAEQIQGFQNVTRAQLDNYTQGMNQRPVNYDWVWMPGGKDYKEMVLHLNEDPRWGAQPDTEWPQKNLVMWTRFDTRTAEDGGKVLFAGEMQANATQQAQSEGIMTPETTAVVDAWQQQHDEYSRQYHDAHEIIDDNLSHYADRAGLKTRDWVRAKTVLTQDLDNFKYGSDGDSFAKYVATRPYGSDTPGYAVVNSMTAQELDELGHTVQTAFEVQRNMSNMGDRPGRGVQDRPFLKNPEGPMVRRMIAYAAENGFDYIMLPTKDQIVQIEGWPASHAEEHASGADRYYNQKLKNIFTDEGKKLGGKSVEQVKLAGREVKKLNWQPNAGGWEVNNVGGARGDHFRMDLTDSGTIHIVGTQQPITLTITTADSPQSAGFDVQIDFPATDAAKKYADLVANRTPLKWDITMEGDGSGTQAGAAAPGGIRYEVVISKEDKPQEFELQKFDSNGGAEPVGTFPTVEQAQLQAEIEASDTTDTPQWREVSSGDPLNSSSWTTQDDRFTVTQSPDDGGWAILNSAGEDPPLHVEDSLEAAKKWVEDKYKMAASTGQSQNALRITDAMRNQVKQAGVELFQKGPQGKILGGTQLLPDGRAIQRAMSPDANFLTALHELLHVVVDTLPDEARAVFEKKDGLAPGQWLELRTKMRSGTATKQDVALLRKIEEDYANNGEAYFAGGKGPTPRLAEVFAKIKLLLASMMDRIRKVLGQAQQLPQGLQDVYDSLFKKVDFAANGGAATAPPAGAGFIDALNGKPLTADEIIASAETQRTTGVFVDGQWKISLDANEHAHNTNWQGLGQGTIQVWKNPAEGNRFQMFLWADSQEGLTQEVQALLGGGFKPSQEVDTKLRKTGQGSAQTTTLGHIVRLAATAAPEDKMSAVGYMLTQDEGDVRAVLDPASGKIQFGLSHTDASGAQVSTARPGTEIGFTKTIGKPLQISSLGDLPLTREQADKALAVLAQQGLPPETKIAVNNVTATMQEWTTGAAKVDDLGVTKGAPKPTRVTNLGEVFQTAQGAEVFLWKPLKSVVFQRAMLTRGQQILFALMDDGRILWSKDAVDHAQMFHATGLQRTSSVAQGMKMHDGTWVAGSTAAHLDGLVEYLRDQGVNMKSPARFNIFSEDGDPLKTQAYNGTLEDFMGKQVGTTDHEKWDQAAADHRLSMLSKSNDDYQALQSQIGAWQQDAQEKMNRGAGYRKQSKAESDQFRASFKKLYDEWLKKLEDAVKHGAAEVNRILFDYSFKRNWEELLRYYSPFTTWQLRNPMFWAQTMLQRPGVLAAWQRYREAAHTNTKQKNLTSRFDNTIPLPGQQGLQNAGILPQGYYGFNPSATFGPGSQIQNSFEPIGTPPADSGFQALTRQLFAGESAMGIRPWPWFQWAEEQLGLRPPELRNDLFGPLQQLPGVGPFMDKVQQSMGLGPQRPNADLLAYYTNRRLAELEAQGQLTHEQVYAAQFNDQDPNYQAAQRQILGESDRFQGLRTLEPFSLKYASPGEQTIRNSLTLPNDQRRTGAFDEQALYPYQQSYSRLFQTPDQRAAQSAVKAVNDKYDKQLQGMSPFDSQYGVINGKRGDELAALAAQQPGRVVGSTSFAPQSRQAEVLSQLEHTEPRPGWFTDIHGDVDWNAYDKAYNEFLAQVPDLSRQIGYQVSGDMYDKFRNRYRSPEELIKVLNDRRLDPGYTLAAELKDPSSPEFKAALYDVLKQQLDGDLASGMTSEQAIQRMQDTAARLRKSGLPYNITQDLLAKYGPVPASTLAGDAQQYQPDMMMDQGSRDMYLRQQGGPLDRTAPGLYGNGGPNHQTQEDKQRQDILNYYYTLMPDKRRELRKSLGLGGNPDANPNPVDFTDQIRSLSGIQLSAAAGVASGAAGSIKNSAAAAGDTANKLAGFAGKRLSPEDQKTTDQLDRDWFLYTQASGAYKEGSGPSPKWTPLMEKYYGDPTSPSAKFWDEYNGKVYNQDVFDDPVLSAIVSSDARHVLDYTDAQYAAALKYLQQHESQYVDPKLTASRQQHPEWWQQAQTERAQYQAIADPKLDKLEQTYFNLSSAEQDTWRQEHATDWHAMVDYINTRRQAASKLPYYTYFYRNTDFGKWFGGDDPSTGASAHGVDTFTGPAAKDPYPPYFTKQLKADASAHPDWYNQASDQKKQYDAGKDPQLEATSAQYYSLSNDQRKQFRSEHNDEYRALTAYYDARRNQRKALVWYLYFFNPDDYHYYFGNTPPDQVSGIPSDAGSGGGASTGGGTPPVLPPPPPPPPHGAAPQTMGSFARPAQTGFLPRSLQ